MQFPRPARKSRSEAILPMINVVFLLLIFFMISSRIAPAPPMRLTPPQADAQERAEAETVLFVASDGSLAFGPARGDAALAALRALPAGTALQITADAALPAQDMARLLQDLPPTLALNLTVRR